jgi:hypothetical protein
MRRVVVVALVPLAVFRRLRTRVESAVTVSLHLLRAHRLRVAAAVAAATTTLMVLRDWVVPGELVAVARVHRVRTKTGLLAPLILAAVVAAAVIP